MAKKILYSEPPDYFPKEILEKYFPTTVETPKGKTAKKATAKKAKAKKTVSRNEEKQEKPTTNTGGKQHE